MFGKGDIWFLWKSESNARSAEEIFSDREKYNLHASNLCQFAVKKDSSGAFPYLSLSSLQAMRSSFLDIKLKSGYPLPWLNGILWQVRILLILLHIHFYF